MSEHYIARFYLPEYFKSIINITKCFQKFVINIIPLSEENILVSGERTNFGLCASALPLMWICCFSGKQ